MMQPTHPDPIPTAQGDISLRQNVEGDGNQAIGQVLGGMVVYISGGQAVFHSASTESASSASKPTPSNIGPNPFKGLMAFQETDGDRFFGREKQITALWKKLHSLHEKESAIRVLPIYGPSGSGKSSLARAGLIPELARYSIPGYDRARVAILVPGTHPLESLATVLARIVTQDLTPVAKTCEFAGELKQINETGEYDGLRRIADVILDIEIAPLVVLVDQFEEVYTLCKDTAEREAFVGNLLNAAGDLAKRVTVIITLRSDFLGETQKHAVLNRLFSEQGYLVPAMNPEELRQAIAKPAELAGHPLDAAIIDLLVKDTEGREGALPLLQFALTRIWEGLAEGKPPAETLKAIGGVGGALAGEAQRIYDSLDDEGRAIARRLFLGLVQLGEGTKDTRRRTLLDSLISYQDQPMHVKQIINLFAAPGVRLITLSTSSNTETAEVTHEALFEHWQQLRIWLEGSRSDIRFQRRLDEAAHYWDDQGRAEGLLWRSPDLEVLQSYSQRAGNEMTVLQVEFLEAAQQLFQNTKRWKRIGFLALILGLLITTSTAGFATYQLQQAKLQQAEAERRRVEQLETLARVLLFTNPTEALVTSISAVGLSQSGILGSLNEPIPLSLQNTLFDTVQLSREIALLKFGSEIRSVAFNASGNLIVVGTNDGALHLVDLQGKLVGQPFKGHRGAVFSVAFSPDGELIASAGADKTIRLWNLQGHLVREPFKGSQAPITSVTFSANGKTVISGGMGGDSTIRLWDLQGHLIRQPFHGHSSTIWSVAASPDGKFIASGGHDGTVRLWNFQGNQLWQRSRDNDLRVYSVIFKPDSKSIYSGSNSSNLNKWDLKGNLIGYPSIYDHPTDSLAISADGNVRAIAGDRKITISSASGSSLFGRSLLGHKAYIRGVAVSPNGRFIVSGDLDGEVRLWDLQNSTIGQLTDRSSPTGANKTNLLRSLNIKANERNESQLFDLQGKAIGQPLKYYNKITYASINSNGTLVATVDENGIGQLWNLQGSTVGQSFEIKGFKEKNFYSIAFDSKGDRVILSESNSGTGTIRFFDLEGLSIGAPITGFIGSINSIASTPEGELILDVGNSKQWKLTWKDWLKASCDRLQYHPLLVNPKTNTAKEAQLTCQRYAWSKQ